MRELKNILRIAVPSTIATLGHLIYSLIDSLMVGRFLGAEYITSAGIASSLYHIFLPFGVGSLSFIAGKISYHIAKEGTAEVKNVFKDGLIFSIIAGFAIAFILFAISPFINLFITHGEVGMMASEYLKIICFCAIFSIPFLAFEKSSEGLGDTRVVVFVMIFTNVLNVILNYILILGKFGFPPYGLKGVAVATLVCCGFELLLIILLFPHFKKLQIILKGFFRYKFEIGRFLRLVKFAVPSGMQVFFESSMFAICMLFASFASVFDGSAYQISMIITTVPFITIYGFLGAITVRVAHYVALKDRRMILKIIKYSFISILILMLIASLMYRFYSFQIATFFLQEERQNLRTIEILSFSLMFIGIIEIFDALQILMSSILRGMGDAKIPSFISFFCFWCLSIPFAFFLGVSQNLGMLGVWLGIGVGIVLSFILLSSRVVHFIRERGNF